MSSSSVSEKGDTTAVEIEGNGFPKELKDDIYMWQQTFYKSNQENLIKFPKRVIEQCLSKEQKSITLIDEENNKSYECDIETANDGSNEKYISKAWFQCSEDMGLKDGDKLLFTAQNPPENLDLPPTEMSDLSDSKSDRKFGRQVFRLLNYNIIISDNKDSRKNRKHITSLTELKAPRKPINEDNFKLNCKTRQKLVLKEGQQLSEFFKDHSFQLVHLAAIYQHLRNSQPEHLRNLSRWLLW